MDTTPTESTASEQERDQRVNDVVARILARSGTALASTAGQDNSGDAGALEREARAGTRRVDTGASDREDISEVEYRQVRLEKVVLVGLRTTQSEEEAENSLRELAALAETAGSRVLDGIIQRRMKPDPATYLGSGKARELADIVRSVEADTVIVTGRPTLSRPIHALLARPDVRVVVVDPHAPWVDVSGNASVVVADLEATRGPVDAAQAEWASRVRDAAREAGERIDSLLASGSGRTMLDLARAVAASTSGPLVLGASNPVRAFDLAVPTLEGRIVHSNRGQAGIDGTIATAVGICLGSGYAGEVSAPAGERVTAVIGDLTACHDASSLALAASAGAHLDIVVADDQGGGIFATLEHGRATSPEAYERWFGLAQSVDYEALAAAYGVAFARAETPAQLAQLLETGEAGPRLVHAPVERAAHLYPAVHDVLS